jgi:hypothetical protein
VELKEVTHSVKIAKVRAFNDFDVKKTMEKNGRRGFRGKEFVV